ncbi:MAG: hypothetical protein ACYS76_16045 [Planctomycetota bacterium]
MSTALARRREHSAPGEVSAEPVRLEKTGGSDKRTGFLASNSVSCEDLPLRFTTS